MSAETENRLFIAENVTVGQRNQGPSQTPSPMHRASPDSTIHPCTTRRFNLRFPFIWEPPFNFQNITDSPTYLYDLEMSSEKELSGIHECEGKHSDLFNSAMKGRREINTLLTYFVLVKIQQIWLELTKKYCTIVHNRTICTSDASLGHLEMESRSGARYTARCCSNNSRR